MTKRVLIAPLDWGLGHASRCIPVIKKLLQIGAVPIIATSGRPLTFLKKEFPGEQFLELPAYDLNYFSTNMYLNLAIQSPKILKAIQQERKKVKKWISQYKIDAIISDNRFGCLDPRVKNVFITHQLNIIMPGKMPGFFKHLLSGLANRVNHRYIGKFDECWVPDEEGDVNLSGILSHPAPLPNVQYTGILSRIKTLKQPLKYDIMVLLSGPEPQRSKLEQGLIRQLTGLKKRILLVQGVPEKSERFTLGDHFEVLPFLTSADLNQALAQSELVICRSGYSTLMDLAPLGKKAILIPTPGQSEQKYLAQYLEEKGICNYQEQKNLDIIKAIRENSNYTGFDENSFKRNKNLEKLLRAFLT